LLIEDEPDVADLASEMLAEEGYRVVIAHDGFEALKIYERMGKQIGLVILDYFVPVMDGDAVFEELRSLNPKVNVVLSSGFARADQGRFNVVARSSRFHPEALQPRQVAGTGPLNARRHASAGPLNKPIASDGRSDE